MKRGGYEAHITIDKSYGTTVAQIAEELGWIFSQITGCHLLGPGTYCYLSAYHPTDPAILLDQMERAQESCWLMGVPVLRSKIEHIVFDTKTGVDEIDRQDRPNPAP